jgi:hypothetical protein
MFLQQLFVMLKKARTIYEGGMEVEEDKKKEIERVGTNFQSLPVEIVMEIIKYMSYSDMCQLMNLCYTLRKAVGILVRKGLAGLGERIRRIGAEELNGKKGRRWQRAARSRYVHIRYLLLEALLLRVTVIRYQRDPAAWNPLCRYLAPLLDLLETKAADDVTGEMKPLEEFYEKFDETIEPHLFGSPGCVGFEVRAVDVLLCCPSSNLQLEMRPEEGSLRLEMFVEMRGPWARTVPNKLQNNTCPQMTKERLLVKYLRNVVRGEMRDQAGKLPSDLDPWVAFASLNDLRLALLYPALDRPLSFVLRRNFDTNSVSVVSRIHVLLEDLSSAPFTLSWEEMTCQGLVVDLSSWSSQEPTPKYDISCYLCDLDNSRYFHFDLMIHYPYKKSKGWKAILLKIDKQSKTDPVNINVDTHTFE